MFQRVTVALVLEPESGVDIVDGVTVATSADPWLEVMPAEVLTSRRWVRLRYSTSYFDDPVRPLIRFRTSRGREFIQPMNGPVLGRGEWLGRVPDGTVSVSISPAKAPGRFDFRLESIEPVPRASLVRRGLAYDRRSLLQSVGAKIINADEERWETLKFAASATAFQDYAQWFRQRCRPFDPEGLDRPRSDWRAGTVIRLVMELRAGGVDALKQTLASLRAQVYGRWSLQAVRTPDTGAELLAAFRAEMAGEPRLALAEDDGPLLSNTDETQSGDYVAVIENGDLIPDYAFAVVAEAVAAKPHARVIYGDEDAISADGTPHSPVFKPDWSPVYFCHTCYFGRLTCLRYDTLTALGVATTADLVRDESDIVKRAAMQAADGDICHLRRILYRRRRDMDTAFVTASGKRCHATPALSAPEPNPQVSVIIPTRDRPDLLAQCMKSLLETTDYPPFEIVIVDNGSVDSRARALLNDYGRRPRVKVLDRPGPFNFSSLCNDGARAAASPMLVFLNNDIVVCDRAWLRVLVSWAARPDIGAAGAKLLFPDDTIEHAGVVIGHGGMAGHIYPGRAAAEAGYMNQLMVPRDVLAVTGACIAIARDKFDAVGGFDAEHLPVDLNDIDLCLKLVERGWKIVWTPDAVLYHLQSATRGFPLKPFKVYRKERDYFQKRWAHVIRDDPFFHPALSLFSHQPALA